MKKLVLLSAFFLASISLSAFPGISDFVVSDCNAAYQNTYFANVDQYGHEMAEQMAVAAWNVCMGHNQ